MAAGFFILEDTLSALMGSEHLVAQAQDRARELAPRIEAYAKQNAPWTDRTGQARAGLGTNVYAQGTEVIIELYHSVDYGYWLEVIQSGRFAIIMPTLEALSGEVMGSMGAVQTGVDF